MWLSESFAEYMGYEVAGVASRFTSPWTTFAVVRKAWGYDADQRPSTHPVAAESLDDVASALMNFDGISYAKGASALRQLVTWVGPETFISGVNDYFAAHRFGNADLGDLLDAIAGAAGRDVRAWADRWLRTAGVDTLRAERAGDGSLTMVPDDPENIRPHRLLVGVYDGDDGRLVRRRRVEAEISTGEVSVPIPAPRPALLVVNDGDLTYAKVRLDEDSWQAVTAGLSTIDDPLTRALLWNTARDMVRDGDLPVADFLRLVEAHLPAENEVTIVEGVLTFARRRIADRYVRPGERPAALAAITRTAANLMERAGDAPDLRLAAARALISGAQNDGELTRLRDWLAQGRVAAGGPDLDPDLRWQVLLQLCVYGHAGETEIEAEQTRDPSATGAQGAARCRSALPTPEAKQRAWDLLFTPGSLSNHLLTATAEGFWQPARPEVTAPFLDRYFDEVVPAGERGAVVARALGEALFPAHAATPETVRAASACLTRNDLTTPLRRALADQLDDLQRALRIRNLQPASPT